MREILEENECNDTYGRIRMYQALILKQPEHVEIPSERTVYRVMEEIGISHHPRRKPNGPGSQKIRGSSKTGFPSGKTIGQMRNRYNGDQSQ